MVSTPTVVSNFSHVSTPLRASAAWKRAMCYVALSRQRSAWGLVVHYHSSWRFALCAIIQGFPFLYSIAKLQVSSVRWSLNSIRKDFKGKKLQLRQKTWFKPPLDISLQAQAGGYWRGACFSSTKPPLPVWSTGLLFCCTAPVSVVQLPPDIMLPLPWKSAVI